MQYETIILEMLARIKKLEEDVSILKQEQSTFFAMHSVEEESGGDSTVPHQKITDERIDICYSYAKRVYAGENIQEIADEVVNETGMNRNSVIMYLYAINGMLNGTIYKRAISAKAVRRYFDIIFREYGSEGLKKAIHSVELHINYRKECGHTIDSIEEIYNEYKNKL